MTDTSNLVREHANRCVESYGMDIDVSEPPSREVHEMMRADLMIAVGMLFVLAMILAEEARKP